MRRVNFVALVIHLSRDATESVLSFEIGHCGGPLFPLGLLAISLFVKLPF